MNENWFVHGYTEMKKSTWGKTVNRPTKTTDEEHFASCNGLWSSLEEATGYKKAVGYKITRDLLRPYVLRDLTKESGRISNMVSVGILFYIINGQDIFWWKLLGLSDYDSLAWMQKGLSVYMKQ